MAPAIRVTEAVSSSADHAALTDHPADVHHAPAPGRAVALGAAAAGRSAAAPSAGALQWALEGAGWRVLRPTVDFVFLCLALSWSLRCAAHVHTPARLRAPLLAFPLCRRAAVLPARALPHAPARAVLDGVVPVISAVSIGAMAVAVLGVFVNGHAPRQSEVVRVVAVRAARRRHRAHRAVLRPALGARAAPGRQAGADHGRRRRRRAGRAAAGESPRVRARADRLPRRGPALDRRGRRARPAGARHGRGSRRDRHAHGRAQPDRGLLLGRRRARQPSDPALPGTRRRGLGRAAHVRHDQQPRRLRHGRRPAADVLHDGRPARPAVRDQARPGPRARAGLPRAALARDPALGAGRAPELSWARAVPPAPRRTRRQGLRPLQVPLDAHAGRARRPRRRRRRPAGVPARRRHRAGRRRGRRPPHARRALPASHLLRRAAAAVQRAARAR